VRKKIKGGKMAKVMRKETVFVILMIAASSLFGCATQSAVIPTTAPVAKPSAPASYVIQDGDQLDVKFFYNPELNESVVVRPDGRISLQLVGEVQAAGKTPAELDKELTDMYSQELRKPTVTVIVKSFAGQRVYVGGEVNTQGLILLPSGMTALQAVFQSGGFKDTAQPADTLVIRKGEGNRPVPIRVNLASAVNDGKGAGFQLQPDDVVYVPKSAIAEANQFVNQYIERLFLFRGVSLGFSWELHGDKNN
jgi:polysaccharide export outer membrane protein